MTTRPIIFSTAMVQALLAGRKTQTRRLGTSPLRHVEVGDLLYVREAFARCGANAYPDDSMVRHESFGAIHRAGWDRSPPAGGWKPSIHMPRWASRLTLKVTRIRHDRLRNIDWADSIAEGIQKSPHGNEDQWMNYPDGSSAAGWENPKDSFRTLWESLHDKPGERWEDNPMIVALTFEVHRCNVDRMEVAHG